MADGIVCSCVTCPNGGTWVVLASRPEVGLKASKLRNFCPAQGCAVEFEFRPDEAHTFQLPHVLFEKRYFYRSELKAVGT